MTRTDATQGRGSSGEGKQIDSVTIELPRYTTCGLCNGEPLTDEGKRILSEGTGFEITACPQCQGEGVNPFPPMPVCGHEGCSPRSIELAGRDSPDEDAHPIYRCSEGHYTRIIYTEEPAS